MKHSGLRRWLAAAMLVVVCTGCGAASENTTSNDSSTTVEATAVTLTETAALPEVAITTEDSGDDTLPVKATGNFFAMDTYMRVVVYTADEDTAETAIRACVSEVNRLENLLSTNVTSSEIYQLNEAGTLTVSDETAALIERSLAINEDTNGNFDITVYPLVQAWGFTTESYQVPEQETIDSLLANVGTDGITITDDNTVTLADGVKIDLGALAKGYTSTQLMTVLEENGVTSGLVSLGGNVQVLGEKPDGSAFQVAIQNPDNPEASSYAAVLQVTDTAVITSGGYERYFEEDGVRYHHIIDPSTGYPADGGLTSVTIVSPDGTLDDATATALYIMGIDDAIAYWRAHSDEFDILLIDDAGQVYASAGLENQVIEADLGEVTIIEA